MPPWLPEHDDRSGGDSSPSIFAVNDSLQAGHSSVEPESGLPGHSRQQRLSDLKTSLYSHCTPPFSACSLPNTSSETDSVSNREDYFIRTDQPQRPRRKLEVCVPKSTLPSPRGRYDGWIPPAPRVEENIALRSLLESLGAQSNPRHNESFIEFELDKFSVYIDSKLYPYELRPLQQLSTKGPDEFFFDGVLRHGHLMVYVEKVPFSELPIGNYDTTYDTVADQIWIRSRVNADKEIYYRLKAAATEYERFYEPFLWIADLAKHVVDYCRHLTRKNKAVTLQDFQHRFLDWLQRVHKSSPVFRQWHQVHGSDDFRTAITANVEFIWKEVYGVFRHRAAHSLQLFKEIRQLTQYRPFALVLGDKRNPVQPRTVVTPYVYKCFRHSEFGALLEPLNSPNGDVAVFISGGGDVSDLRTNEETEQDDEDVPEVANAFNLPRVRLTSNQFEPTAQVGRRKLLVSIRPGDTISTPPDGAGTGTKWKNERSKGSKDDHRWFGLVQRVHVSPKTGSRSFDVTWLYRPVDTPCGKMAYPWGKELFLSDHCTCEDGWRARVHEDEVLERHDVDWFGNPQTSTAEFFVRQTYQVQERRWVTLERRHMTCLHDQPVRLAYRSGDTVLVACSEKETEDRAKVYEVVDVFKRGNEGFVRLRRLQQRQEVESAELGIRPNELVYTEQMVVMKPQRILRRCIVRFFDAAEPIPCPYNRNGTGNIFFITHKLENGACVPIAVRDRSTTMRQGFDPRRRVENLKGLDLFCGSGNFGRGLEEGGGVEMCWTNDIWTEAIHTYMVNAIHHTKPFLGSVDDLLRCAIEGDHRHAVPKQGEVDFISGGSPCQGFSLITSNKTTHRQKKNRSLVASFASFVDFYRPKYGILENVLGIVQTGRNRDEDAFSQLICAIVGMGYQTQLTLGDAWSYGAPQSRSRAFLYFAAPEHRLPDPPRPSHSHFDGVRSRGLGIMTNGESFVSRSFDATPFKFVSAAEATADIPEIHDAKPDYCIGFPDHRCSKGVTAKSRCQYRQIPTHPYGMNFSKTWDEGKGIMTPAERELFPDSGLRVQKVSRGWGRVKPNSVFHTITTDVMPTDARTGRFLHWHEDRPITILEARRAQGFLDHEVLVGNPAAQYELVGNSVARPIALALGLQFREAWLGSLYDDMTPVSGSGKGGAGRGEQRIEAPMVEDGAVQDDAQDQTERDWADDSDSLFSRDSPDELSFNRNRATDTPLTRVSRAEIGNLAFGASRKRPHSSSAVELLAFKVRRTSHEHPRPCNDSQVSGADSGTTGTTTNGIAAEHLSPAVVVEREHTDLVTEIGKHGLNADAAASLSNGSMAAHSRTDLEVTDGQPRAGVTRTTLRSSTPLVIDLTED